MTLASGTRIGGYEVTRLLGSGGMGEVYRAHDSRLNRDVAIKVLLPSVANDAERLARFAREAQVLASLDHPNIAHIHGLEPSDPAGSPVGLRALVMELAGAGQGDDRALTGETRRTRRTRRARKTARSDY
jgi:serine/threonine protein kinase